MASLWDKATDFLSKPAVRIGLAAGSALGGMGAFSGLDRSGSGGTNWENVANTALGIGNLASAASSKDMWSVPQAVLGGYGVLQDNQIGGVGNFGTYGDSYDRVRQAPAGFGSGMSAFFTGGTTSLPALSAAPSQSLVASRQARTDLSEEERRQQAIANSPQTFPVTNITPGAMPRPNEAFLALNPDQGTNYKHHPSITGSQPAVSGDLSNYTIPTSAAVNNAGRSNFWGNDPSKNTLGTDGYFSPSMNTPNATWMDTTHLTPNASAMVTNRLGGEQGSNVADHQLATRNLAIQRSRDVRNKVLALPGRAVQYQADEVKVTRDAAVNAKVAGFSFEKAFNTAFEKIAANPLEAISVGGALISAFTDTRDEDAANAYAEEMAMYRQRMDPSTSFAQEWQTAYIDDKSNELDKQFRKAEADLAVTMSRRGITDSTITTSARSSLAKAKADLAKDFKSQAYQAYAEYQKTLIAAETYGSKVAARGAMVAGSGGPNFQAALKSSVKAVGA